MAKKRRPIRMHYVTPQESVLVMMAFHDGRLSKEEALGMVDWATFARFDAGYEPFWFWATSPTS